MNIDLTDEDAKLFLKFRELQDIFEVLDECGAFDVRNGSTTMHFNADGALCDVECRMKLYRPGIQVVPVLIPLKLDV